MVVVVVSSSVVTVILSMSMMPCINKCYRNVVSVEYVCIVSSSDNNGLKQQQKGERKKNETKLEILFCVNRISINCPGVIVVTLISIWSFIFNMRRYQMWLESPALIGWRFDDANRSYCSLSHKNRLKTYQRKAYQIAEDITFYTFIVSMDGAETMDGMGFNYSCLMPFRWV